MKISSCNICKKKSLKKILVFGKKPIVHHLKNSNKEKEKQYEFDIAKCKNCGHLQIYKNINPKILYKDYFTPSSWKNNWHTKLLIDKMISIYNLKKDNQILEIGSNDGFFIDEFKKKNFNNIYGVEPSRDVFLQSKKKGHKVINKFFSNKIIDKEFKLKKKFDLIYSRQVLEHITNLNNFLKEIDKSLSKDGYLMLEVPDHDMNYENFDYSFWEEHVNYFNLNTLELLLLKNNYRIIHHETTLYSGKALIVFAEKNKRKTKYSISSNKNFEKIDHYQKKFDIFRKEFENFLKKFNKKNIYVYGCGNRSCNIVNLVGLGKYITGFIDDNKEKQNKIVPHCNLKIFSSKSIDLDNSVILLGVNSENENAIIKKTNSKDIYSILPPSVRLPEFWKILIEKNKFKK
jgi:SAM-dependent methyltransferase